MDLIPRRASGEGPQTGLSILCPRASKRIALTLIPDLGYKALLTGAGLQDQVSNSKSCPENFSDHEIQTEPTDKYSLIMTCRA